VSQQRAFAAAAATHDDENVAIVDLKLRSRMRTKLSKAIVRWLTVMCG